MQQLFGGVPVVAVQAHLAAGIKTQVAATVQLVKLARAAEAEIPGDEGLLTIQQLLAHAECRLLQYVKHVAEDVGNAIPSVYPVEGVAKAGIVAVEVVDVQQAGRGQRGIPIGQRCQPGSQLRARWRSSGSLSR